MSTAKRVLVIIEPTQERHLALERVVVTSDVEHPDSHVHLFIGVNGDTTDLRATNQALYHDDQWLKTLLHPLQAKGIRHSFELCWSNDWQGAVLNSARRFRPDHIFMPDYKEAKKAWFFSNQQWSLLRNNVAPVTIVRPDTVARRRKILAAVNFQREDDPRYAQLNEKILTGGQNIAKHYGADFHVINAYSNSLNFPDRDRILKVSGLPTQNVHVREGDPAEVIVDFAKEIGADTVIIGTMARQGASALMKGNTSEKVLSRLSQDVIAFS